MPSRSASGRASFLTSSACLRHLTNLIPSNVSKRLLYLICIPLVAKNISAPLLVGSTLMLASLGGTSSMPHSCTIFSLALSISLNASTLLAFLMLKFLYINSPSPMSSIVISTSGRSNVSIPFLSMM